ncbi:hypothetical protein M408DRAFT_80817 [Serendipita vermifera MAFF 305830]|uniref:aminodeoxychorismate synthase n=1 Tax=Serendipita vermifera MAFF 305830 TaxID=933852 RepID=A0A0C3AMK2_SERVB|nr:hypothetical protein M408DRAFT_80817 [Serendipita vermifera MAFF 305830]
MDISDPRLLFIDSYDSFTNNLTALCRKAIPHAHIHVIKNDRFTIQKLLPHLESFAAIIVGPGPGSPEDPKDIGVIRDLWAIGQEHLLPIFGVCLGLQSLAIEHGAQLQKLRTVKHGQVSSVHHTGTDLFNGISLVRAVRYHSLHVVIPRDCDLEELAYADDGAENGKVTMAIKHTQKPFWAVQYHPESVLTTGGGIEVIENFWTMASRWNKIHRPDAGCWNARRAKLFSPSWPSLCMPSQMPRKAAPRRVVTRMVDARSLDSVAIADLAGASVESTPFVLLDSAASPGRYSIIGFLSPKSYRITHFVGEDHVTVLRDGSTVRESIAPIGIWKWIAAFMETRIADGGNKDVPFWGGLVGYLSYELGCSIFASPTSSGDRANRQPDVNVIYVERSVVLDNVTRKAYIQSIIPKDETWISSTAKSISRMAGKNDIASSPDELDISPIQTAKITLPERSGYISRINAAKEHLASGNSYELCLTAETKVQVSRSDSHKSDNASTSWHMYRNLRKRNPAPHAAYLRLHPTTVLSSSPERFLSFSRPPHSMCQLRPIKGTLRKAPGITRVDAERGLVGSVKEVAENLMIVDLIRHDLHGVVGEDVNVKQFCTVEEYETVWQMVSVIEGKPSTLQKDAAPQFDHGWRVLRECLPPGSMTGAPKKRSVEILHDLENNPRGIYSGVLGYWDVGGGGDWAVIIRSCFKHDNSGTQGNGSLSEGNVINDSATEEWSLGAGGAITALSDPQAEWDEMILKLQSVLGIFKETPKQ